MEPDVDEVATSSSWIFWAVANVCGGLRSVVELLWWLGGVSFRIFPMDTLNTLLLGWLVFGLSMAILAKFIYAKFQGGSLSEPDPALPTQNGDPTPPSEKRKGSELSAPVEQPRKATIVPEALPPHVPAPMATGGDPDAVRWINNLLVWFFEGHEGGAIMKEAWNDNLNEYTVGVALETGVLIEIIEFLPQTTAPSFSNIIVDCSPTDDINVTCDMTITLYMRVQTTRTQRDVTTESEYACAVRPLRGRLNVALKTHACVAFVSLSGWPEVSSGDPEANVQVILELEGVRNNSEGLDEIQLQEVVKEELTAALRKVTLELDFSTRKTFPRFSRQRTLPGSVMPVGYDALVRERQTFPPSFETKIPASRFPVSPRFKSTGQSPKTPGVATNHVEGATTLTPPSIPERACEASKKDFLSLGDDGREVVNLLTVSEESLVRRNLEKYCEDLAREERAKSNNAATPELSPSTVEIPSRYSPDPTENRFVEPGSRAIPVSRTALVFSSREKPIDEPSGHLTSEGVGEEEGIPLHDMKEREKSPKDFDSLKMSLKETILNNPFGKHLPNSKSSSQASQSNASPVGIVGLNGKRLLVKVVKATDIGGEAGVSSCFTVVEMDEPPQKFSTTIVDDTSSPFWDEQFLFDLSDNTLELLLEIYDQKNDRFVGLGIVGIEELVATPSQRQIIPLQGRPYEKDQVSGSLTCEFLFLDRADLPDLTLRKTLTDQSGSGKVKTTTTTYVKPPDQPQVDSEAGVSTAGVAETALRDLEEKQTNLPAPNTRSTLIIHASKKVTRTPSGEYAELTNGAQLPEEPSQQDDDSEYYKPGVSLNYGSSPGPQKGPLTPLKSTGIVTAVPLSVKVIPASTSAQHAVVESQDPSPVSNGLSTEERGRSRSRQKRDFFGSLRRHFSRSKVRSQSVDPTASSAEVDTGAPIVTNTDTLGGGRSISMERSTSLARSRGFLSVPLVRGRANPSGGIGSGDSGSTRSSLSGTSGLSSSSTKTYINEASLLVVETLENAVIKHYLVPLSLQRKNKWRRKGTKLHIFNEHTFVAKHLSSSVTCEVCQKGIGRRLGKQGYECRDCCYKCHKPCHVKTDLICPNSTVNSMDLTLMNEVGR